MLFQAPSLWYFIMEAQENTYSHVGRNVFSQTEQDPVPFPPWLCGETQVLSRQSDAK